MQQPQHTVIEVFADIWCPFAHVGLRAVDERRRLSGREDVLITVRSWPLELVNGTPLDPIVTSHHVELLRAHVAPTLFKNFDPTRFPTSTLEALALVVRAYRAAPKRGEQMSFALRDALFEHGHDISDPIILQSIAEGFELELPDRSDSDAVLADWAEGREREVRGSPHFFCGDHDAFCPSLEITRSAEQGLSVSRDVEALAEFFSKCLDGERIG